MLAEQAVQNAAKVEEAYGGLAQRSFDSSHSFFTRVQAAHMDRFFIFYFFLKRMKYRR